MKPEKESSCHKLYVIGPTLYEKMLPLLNDVEKQEIIVFNGEIKDGVVEKFKSKCFPCGGCKKNFTSIFALKRHFKTFHMLECCKLHTTPENTKTPQTSAKKYSCQACDKSFTQSHNLNTHILKVHRGQKQYSCQACEKKYKYKKNLKIHILTVHRGQKPYYCQACDKSYTQSSSLKTHILTFHRGQKYYCQACDKSYTRSHTLKTHMQKCGHTHIQKVHEELKLPQSSAGIKNEFTPDEVDRMTPNVENETLKKPKWTRGQKRKKSMPQGKIFKQIHLEALLDALNSEFGL